MTNEQAERTLEEQMRKSQGRLAKQNEVISAYMKALHLLNGNSPGSRIEYARAADLLEEEKNAFLDEYVDYGCVAEAYILVIDMLREKAKNAHADGEDADNRRFCVMRDNENGNCLCMGGYCASVDDTVCNALHHAYNSGKRHMYLTMKDGC